MSFTPKYKYYQNGNTVIAVSSYAGKRVRGIAKCSPDDTFDLEKGRQLAAARCNAKIARKRLERAINKRDEALEMLDKAENYLSAMCDYVSDSLAAIENADDKLSDLLEDM